MLPPPASSAARAPAAADPVGRRREVLASHARQRVAVKLAPCCSLCGSRCQRPPIAPTHGDRLTPLLARRYHHHPLWQLRIRACDLCLKDNLLSAPALYHHMGIDFTKHIPALVQRCYYFVVDKSEGRLLAHFSHRSIDVLKRACIYTNQIFFWRPHLEAIFDLREAEARQHRARTVAAPRLTAAVRALYTRLLIAHQGKRIGPVSSHLFYTQGSVEWNQGSHALHITQLPISAVTDRMVAARALLQRLFVAHKDRLVVTNTRKPRSTYAALAQHEAYRAAHPAQAYCPAPSHIRSLNEATQFRAQMGKRPPR